MRGSWVRVPPPALAVVVHPSNDLRSRRGASEGHRRSNDSGSHGALREAGYLVAVPFGENTRYDLVIDDGARLERVQCKTGRLRAGAVVFNTASSYAHLPSPREPRRTYHGQIDYFRVYCPETRGVYLIPIDDVTCTKEARLRVEPALNGQQKRIRLASDYQIGTVEVPQLYVTRALRASSGAR